MRIVFLFLFSFFIIAVACNCTYAKVQPERYGVTLQLDTKQLNAIAYAKADSFLATNSMLARKASVSAIVKPHVMNDKTVDFYLLLLLCIVLGLVAYTDPRYFNNLWRVFTTPGQSTAAREQMELSVISNSLMNLLFVIVGGAYVFYIVGSTDTLVRTDSRALFISVLVLGVAVIYFTKYIVLVFTGWAFKIKQITNLYIFNVFLMNKIMAVILLPMVVVLAFADKYYHTPILIISTVVVAALFFNRYLRSWRAFGSFFQYSRFHFFTYLCASEILPLAVLMKLLVNGFVF